MLKKSRFISFVVAGLLVLALAGFAAAAEPSVYLKLGIETHPGQARNISCEHWIELIEAYSSGDIDVELFPSAVLGEPNEIMEGMIMGTVDLTVQGSGLVGGTIPSFNIIYLPYRWVSQAHLNKFLETERYREEMVKPLHDRGIRLITNWERSPRHLITRNLVVDEASDVNQLMLRVPAAKATVAAWQALGCSTQTIGMTEIYTAMQQGVIDGVEAPMEALNGMGCPEILKELSLTAHVYDAEVVMISEKAFAKLTPEQYEIIERAALDTSKWTSDRALSDEAEYIKMFQDKHGVNVTKPDISTFIAATAEVVRQFTEELSPGMDEFINSLK